MVKKIQSLKDKVIVFGPFQDGEVHVVSIDGVNFMVQEVRLLYRYDVLHILTMH